MIEHTSLPCSGRLAAVVLTGGTGARLGGADKAAIELAGTTLLERALAATARAAEVVVVGSRTPTSREVTWAREVPPHGGPAAGLLAGLDALAEPPELVLVLAVDMPDVGVGTVNRLVDALASQAGGDAAVLADSTGRAQILAGVYRFAPLVAARPADRDEEHGLSVRRLIAPLRLISVPARGKEACDVDTWEDLRDLRD